MIIIESNSFAYLTVLSFFSGPTFTEAFNGYPPLQDMFSLLNELPELMATLIYTNNREPQRMYMMLSQVDSFEAFCKIDTESLFINFPNSTWDSKSWVSRLCMIDEEIIIGELMRQPAVYQIGMLVSYLPQRNMLKFK